MNADILLKHFDRISDAPDAIPRLRKFVLDLAVRGKLVEQDPNDEPASALLKRIQVEKSRSSKSSINKKGISEIRPYSVPSNWEWTSLGSISEKLTDGSHNPPRNVETGFPMLSSKNILDGAISFSNPTRYLTDKDFFEEDARTRIEPGDVLLTIVGTIGRSAVVPINAPRFALQRSVAVIRTNLYSNFLSIQLRSQSAQDYFIEHGKGTAQKGIYLGKLASAPIAVPPLAEQHRIVAKVDELMALCDQLEAARNERETRRDRLVSSSLNRISTTAAEEVKEAARFHLDHLPRLTTRPEHIKQLRQTILNLAVRGRLVPQDPNDGNVRQMLTGAFEGRRALIKKGTLTKKFITDAAWLNDSPFKLPKQWVFASFDHLAKPVPNALKAGPFGSALKKEFYVGSGYKIYGQEQVIKQDAHFGDYFISEKKFKELQSCEVNPGDMLISLVGTIGKVLILPPNSKAGIINPRLIKMTLNSELVVSEYIRILLQAPWVREFLFAESHGTTMDVLNLTILRSLPIPLPPLAEQHRIVDKVDELMALCDQLENQLTTTEADSRRLLEAVLRDALVSPLEGGASYA